MSIKDFNSFINEAFGDKAPTQNELDAKTSTDIRGNVIRIGDKLRCLQDVFYMMGQIESDKVERDEIVEVDDIQMTGSNKGDFYFKTHADRYGPFDAEKFLLASDETPLSEDEMDEYGIISKEEEALNRKYFNDYEDEDEDINEGYNLNTLKARADHMKDLYVKIIDRGEEIFKVVSVDVKEIHDGSLVVVSEETGEKETIEHDDIASSIVGDEYEGHNKVKDQDTEEYHKFDVDAARLAAARKQAEYGRPLSSFKRFTKR